MNIGPAIYLSKILFISSLLVLFLSVSKAEEATSRGQIIGGVAHQAPDWFKESFLEIADDAEEAGEEGRQLMLFFQLNGCPYCDRMLEEIFEAEPYRSYIQEHFDVIAINVGGDREIAFNEEVSVSEKELSSVLKVRATPAILFLNEENKTVARVNGYRAPERFKLVLDFVATKSYATTSLSDYLNAKLTRDVYQLRDNPLFSSITDLSSVDGPLMVIFEDGSCYDCNEFHDGILGHELVQKEIAPYAVVRLDADSEETIVDVDGNQTTAAELARKHEMFYRPGVLVFNEGSLWQRNDSLIFPHHFKESLRYVAGKHYEESDYGTYSQRRTEELLAAGVVIDLGRPE